MPLGRRLPKLSLDQLFGVEDEGTDDAAKHDQRSENCRARLSHDRQNTRGHEERAAHCWTALPARSRMLFSVPPHAAAFLLFAGETSMTDGGTNSARASIDSSTGL